MILVVTDAFDDTANAVIAALNDRGAPWARFNLGEFPERSLAGFDPVRPEEGFFQGGAGERIRWGAVRATWIWHPAGFGLGPGLTVDQARFVQSACRHAYRAILAFLGERTFMVNPMDREARAEDKALQLRTAARLGLAVPETLVTNAPEAARAFCRRHPQVVFKTLNPPRLGSGPAVSWFSTRLLGPEDLAALDGIRSCPGIFQPRVPKRFDLRVTLVGDRVFPVEIHSQDDPATAVDFRRCWAEGIHLPHRRHDLPEPVRAQCLALARELGLVYSTTDLVVTPEGEYVFLEVNPSGQYGWIEQATGLPITRALADLLAERDAAG